MNVPSLKNTRRGLLVLKGRQNRNRNPGSNLLGLGSSGSRRIRPNIRSFAPTVPGLTSVRKLFEPLTPVSDANAKSPRLC